MTKRVPVRGKALQKAIIDLARLKGWRCAHNPTIQDARGVWRTALAADARGFPDLILVRDRVIVVEVKGDGDTLKPEQEAWLQAFRDAGVDAYVWTPKSLATGFVEATLS